MRWTGILCGLGLALWTGLAAAQGWTGSGDTVEDLRYRLGILDAEMQDIRGRIEALSGGEAAPRPAISGDAMVRLDRLEEEIRRLTGQVEELAFRQRRIAEDAARRFGDMEFRLTELEGGDISAIPPQAPLGGIGEAGATPPSATAPATSGEGTAGPAVPLPQGPVTTGRPDVSVSESEDLELAVADIQQGRFDQGEDRLERFLSTYPESPLGPEAQFWLGRSNFVRGSYAEAARRHLAGYNADRDGPMAARNLLQLGVTLGRLGQVREACLTLREVRNQFAGGERQVLDAADAERDRLACTR